MIPETSDAEPASAASSARNQRLWGLVELLVVAILLHAHADFFSEHRLDEYLLSFGRNFAFVLNAGEARLLCANLLVALPAALLMLDASLRLVRPGRLALVDRALARPRLTVLGCALVAVILTMIIAWRFDHAQFTDDERAYLWQTKAFLTGSFTAPRPQPAEFFHHRYAWMIDAPGGRWGSSYPPGQPALMLVGTLLGWPLLTQILAVGLIVWFGARLADDLWGEKASVLTAALLAASPALVFVGATLHNSVPTTLFCLVGLRSAIAVRRDGRLRDAAWAGASLGAALVCRPYDAVAVGVAAALLIGIGFARPPRARRAAGLAVAAAAAAPMLVFLLAWQHATTGNALVAPFSRFIAHWPGAKTFGFGVTAFNVPHTSAVAFSKALVAAARLNGWLFGWPISLILTLLVAVGVGRDRGALVLLGVAALHFVAYALYTAPSVHTFGTYYLLPEVPLLSALSARALVDLEERCRRLWPQAAAIALRLAASFGLVALPTFWLPQLAYTGAVADSINEPLQLADAAAKNGPILVFAATMQAPFRWPTSWVFWPPLASPRGDDRVLWAADLGSRNDELIRQQPQRRPYLLVFHKTEPASLEPYTRELAEKHAREFQPKDGGYPSFGEPSLMALPFMEPPVGR